MTTNIENHDPVRYRMGLDIGERCDVRHEPIRWWVFESNKQKFRVRLLHPKGYEGIEEVLVQREYMATEGFSFDTIMTASMLHDLIAQDYDYLDYQANLEKTRVGYTPEKAGTIPSEDICYAEVTICVDAHIMSTITADETTGLKQAEEVRVAIGSCEVTDYLREVELEQIYDKVHEHLNHTD